ncbi:MAG: electron transfer flavoprotein subunit alpha/FixB family protein [candidate division Zixibacteria bacterium]|nr:electron transfer flavoprotein subunit alpha/FixB family protein [candidate division Zixibacteria bacterium]
MPLSGIWVFAQQKKGAVAHTGFELVALGRQLADQTGQPLTAILFGHQVKDAAAELTLRGADRAIVADDPSLAQFTDDLYAGLLAGWISKEQPQIVLGTASFYGKALFPRVAAIADCGLVADAGSVTIKDGKITALKATYGGKAYTEYTLSDKKTAIISIRPKSAEEAAPRGGSGPVEVRSTNGASPAMVTVVASEDAGVGTVNLNEADVIVSGGRGLKAPENYKLVEELAQVLGAASGASRAIVDAGWVPYAKQVGQTGKTVNPKLYIACGISGAIQHLVGMQSSRVIVAINKDPDAPIFTVASYGIVGDLFEYLPEITRLFREKLGR